MILMTGRKQKSIFLIEWESGSNQIYRMKVNRVKLQPNKALIATFGLEHCAYCLWLRVSAHLIRKYTPVYHDWDKFLNRLKPTETASRVMLKIENLCRERAVFGERGSLFLSVTREHTVISTLLIAFLRMFLITRHGWIELLRLFWQQMPLLPNTPATLSECIEGSSDVIITPPMTLISVSDKA